MYGGWGEGGGADTTADLAVPTHFSAPTVANALAPSRRVDRNRYIAPSFARVCRRSPMFSSQAADEETTTSTYIHTYIHTDIHTMSSEQLNICNLCFSVNALPKGTCLTEHCVVCVLCRGLRVSLGGRSGSCNHNMCTYILLRIYRYIHIYVWQGKLCCF